ncbi:MAG: hypothetical protein AAB686_03550, partial [Patescibacteria group bacterium]
MENKKQNGFVLIATILVMTMLLVLGIFVTSSVLTEMKISASQTVATQTYYLAESALAEAIWKLKNDDSWKNGFETDPDWTVSYTRDPAFGSRQSYKIEIANSREATGRITATGFSTMANGHIAKRIIKANIYKPLAASIIGENGESSDGNIDLSGSVMNVHDGGVFSNGNIILNNDSVLNAEGIVKATGNILTSGGGAVNAEGTQSQNYPPEPDPLPFPVIIFNEPGSPNSYKDRADRTYTENQFEDLLWENQTLVLDGITYVTGDIEIKGGQDLTINGALVAEGNVTLGKTANNCCWGTRCGLDNITVTRPDPDEPAGIMGNNQIFLESCLNNLDSNGLIYGTEKMYVLSVPGTINVIGGLISRKLTLS